MMRSYRGTGDMSIDTCPCLSPPMKGDKRDMSPKCPCLSPLSLPEERYAAVE